MAITRAPIPVEAIAAFTPFSPCVAVALTDLMTGIIRVKVEPILPNSGEILPNAGTSPLKASSKLFV